MEEISTEGYTLREREPKPKWQSMSAELSSWMDERWLLLKPGESTGVSALSYFLLSLKVIKVWGKRQGAFTSNVLFLYLSVRKKAIYWLECLAIMCALSYTPWSTYIRRRPPYIYEHTSPGAIPSLGHTTAETRQPRATPVQRRTHAAGLVHETFFFKLNVHQYVNS